MLDQLIEEFPIYDRVANLCDDDSDDMLKESVRNLYVDLLGFFHCIIRIFFRGNGRKSAQSTLTVATSD